MDAWYVPFAQSVHGVDLPESLLYLPAGQTMQWLAAVCGWYFPALQFEQELALVLLYLPVPHVEQFDALCPLYLPAPQSRQLDARNPLYLPPTQSVHVAAALSL